MGCIAGLVIRPGLHSRSHTVFLTVAEAFDFLAVCNYELFNHTSKDNLDFVFAYSGSINLLQSHLKVETLPPWTLKSFLHIL